MDPAPALRRHLVPSRPVQVGDPRFALAAALQEA